MPPENPYVGPRPFESADARFFFGRDREIRDLVALIVSNPVVLLYAASGAGKSSLINAAVVGRLERAQECEVLPVARVRGLREQEVPSDGNVFVAAVVSHFSGGESTAGSLRAYLREREHPETSDGFPAPRALVIDQFEELFTAYPERWEDRPAFFEDLGGAVRDDPLLRVVLAIREDFLAQLDPYARLLPDGLRARYRLERLGPAAALRAAKEPALAAGLPFAPGVAEQLVEDLQKVRLDTEHGPKEVVGEYVEPVQLQVACRSLWEALPEGAETITEEHRAAFGNVDEVLGDFYDEAIAAAATAARMKEHSLRERFVHDFITPMGTRGTVFWTREQTGGIPAAAIEELDSRHLVRAELRAGARWYELTHDRLIEPIRVSNSEFTARRSARRRRRALAAAALVGAAAATVAAAAVAISATSSDSTPREPRPVGAAPAAAVEAAVDQAVEIQQRVSTHALVADVPGAVGEITSVAYSRSRVEGVGAAGILTWTADSVEIGGFGGRSGGWQTTAIAVRGPVRAQVEVRGDESRREWRVVLIRGGATTSLGQGATEAASAAVSRTGRFIAVAGVDGRIYVYDVRARRRGPTYAPPGAARYVTPGFGFDERHVLFAATNGRIVRASTTNQEKPTTVRVLPGRLDGIAVAPLGDQIAAWGSASTITLLDGRYRTAGALPGGGVVSAAFDPRGVRLATSGDGRLRIWRTLPDLVVEHAAIERSSAVVTVRARVTNLGPARSTATSISIPGAKKPVAALDAGESLRVRLTGRAPAGASVPLVVAPSSREQSFANNVARLRTDADVRAEIVEAALAGANQSSKVEYASTSRQTRLQGIIDAVRLPRVPRSANSSGFATWCYWQAGAPDPNGNDYRDAGSDWLIQNGRRVRNALPGDLVIYSIDASSSQAVGRLTAVAVGRGRVVTWVNGVLRAIPLTHNRYPYQIRTYPLQATKATSNS
jgi:hypothetical protein